MMSVFDFGLKATKKALNELYLAIFIKDLGCFAYFYGGESIFTKYWRV